MDGWIEAGRRDGQSIVTNSCMRRQGMKHSQIPGTVFAEMNAPYGVAFAPDGQTLAVADSGNNAIRVVLVRVRVYIYYQDGLIEAKACYAFTSSISPAQLYDLAHQGKCEYLVPLVRAYNTTCSSRFDRYCYRYAQVVATQPPPP